MNELLNAMAPSGTMAPGSSPPARGSNMPITAILNPAEDYPRSISSAPELEKRRPVQGEQQQVNEPRQSSLRRISSNKAEYQFPPSSQKYQCTVQVCGKGFACESLLRKHEATHTKPYKCPQSDCNRHTMGFTSKNDLSRHLNSVHKGRNGTRAAIGYNCKYGQCLIKSKVYYRLDNFRNHLKKLHIHKGSTKRDIEEFVKQAEIACRYQENGGSVDFASDCVSEGSISVTGGVSQLRLGSESTSISTTTTNYAPETPTQSEREPSEFHDRPQWRDTVSPLSPARVRQFSDHDVGSMLRHTVLPPLSNIEHDHPRPPFPDWSLRESNGVPKSPDSRRERMHFLTNMITSFNEELKELQSQEWHDAKDRMTGTRSLDGTDNYSRYRTRTPRPLDTQKSLQYNSHEHGTAIGRYRDQNIEEEPVASRLTAGLPSARSPEARTRDEIQYSPRGTRHLPSIDVSRAQSGSREATVSPPQGATEDVVMGEDRIRSASASSSRQPSIARDTAAALSIVLSRNRSSIGPVTRGSVSEPHRRSDGSVSNSGSIKKKHQLKCSEPNCSSTFNRPCELRKHKMRHSKDFACTFPNCSKPFGSKSDWIRHESSQHHKLDEWKCMEPKRGTKKQGNCGKVCYRKENFVNHLKSLAHNLSDKDRIDEVVKNSYFGRKEPAVFWCGFCENEETGVRGKSLPTSNGWTTRYHHIAKHFDEKADIRDFQHPDKSQQAGTRFDDDDDQSDGGEVVLDKMILDHDTTTVVSKPEKVDNYKVVEDQKENNEKEVPKLKTWYCCHWAAGLRCQVGGPWPEDVHMSCPECNHKRCSQCTMEETRQFGVKTDSGSSSVVGKT